MQICLVWAGKDYLLMNWPQGEDSFEPRKLFLVKKGSR